MAQDDEMLINIRIERWFYQRKCSHRQTFEDATLEERWLQLSETYGPKSSIAIGFVEHELIPIAWRDCHIQTHRTPCRMESVYIHNNNDDAREEFCVEMEPVPWGLIMALEASKSES